MALSARASRPLSGALSRAAGAHRGPPAGRDCAATSAACRPLRPLRRQAPGASAPPPLPPHGPAAAKVPRSLLLRAGPLMAGAGLLAGAGALLPAPSRAGATLPGLRGSPMSTAAAAAGAAPGGAGSSPAGAIVVYVTVPSAEVGEALGSKLVESRLAACVNMVPGVTSIYWWDGKVNKDAELLLIVKSREELLPQLTAFVRANHPYDEPEVIGLPILGGSPSYLKWLHDSTGPAGPA
ncbi:hypothetical protein HYH03_004512 [Edaphochlamys debaryana]|uniref:Uncharacterized protein n=2 Tax=Edaphochlamys debaryana TaxID=47281 RepID=A0A836C327_9CHLO|nr:hypothetical protein HYH03_004512 [Edaphochlamys debaryana]|eukprot:KAG2497353.1 hypothetical protein HYH03_004512 [Edaphochlamys debaryana]